MNWKWRYGDHPCHSQTLPQNLGKYYIMSWFLSLLQLCNCQRILPAFLLAHCQHTASLPPGRTNEVAAKKNSTLANLTSLDHSWSHTRKIINCRNSRIYKTFCYIYKKQCVICFSFLFLVSSRWLPATLFFSDVNLHCLWHLKRNHNVGWGSVWSLSLRRTFHLFLSPRCNRGLEGGGRGWGCEKFILYITKILLNFWLTWYFDYKSLHFLTLLKKNPGLCQLHPLQKFCFFI